MTSSADKSFHEALSALRSGNTEGAERSFKKVLRLQPRHVPTLNLYSVLLTQNGRFDEAERFIKRALMENATSEVTLYNYGILLRAANRLDEALERFRQALAINDTVADTWNNRGATYADLKRYHEALADIDRALAINPRLADAVLNKARALAGLKQHQTALATFDRALTLQPKLARAWLGRGNVCTHLERYDDALAAFAHALALDANLAGAWVGRGTALVRLARYPEASEAYDNALAIQPDHAEAWLGRGEVFAEAKRYNEAIAAYEKALELKPELGAAYNSIGHALREMGRLAESKSAFAKAIETDPTLSIAYLNFAESKKFRAEDPDIAAMEALAAKPDGLSEQDRIYLKFALGKAHADAKNYGRSFEYLLAGNAAKRSTIRYDEAAENAFFDHIETTFTPELIASKSGSGVSSSRPIFVLGMPRSGSTLVEQILSSHPAVEGAGELKAFNDAVFSVNEPDGQPMHYPGYVPMLDGAAIRSIGENYMGQLASLAPDGERVTDKMPSNFFFAGLIHLVLPNAVIIHTMREPVDTCISCFSKLFKQEHKYVYDLAELGRYYVRYQRLMAHWHSVLPQGRIFDVRYEDVVADLEGQARRIIAHCGLPWDDRCLAFHENERPVRTASVNQVRQPIYNSAVNRWRVYGQFLTPLLSELGVAVPADA